MNAQTLLTKAELSEKEFLNQTGKTAVVWLSHSPNEGDTRLYEEWAIFDGDKVIESTMKFSGEGWTRSVVVESGNARTKTSKYYRSV